MLIGAASWIGKRDQQQDAHDFATAGEDTACLVLCDGMGGYANGALASARATRAAMAALQNRQDEIEIRLEEAIARANDAVYALRQQDPQETGTTLLAAHVKGGQLRWASVGDTHLFLIRAGRLRKLNEDHSFRPVLETLVEKGEMTAQEAATDPKRYVLRSALTGDKIRLREITAQGLPLQQGDILILASDGINTLGSGALSALMASDWAGPQNLAEAIVAAVRDLDAPNQDNVSLVVARI